MGGEGLQPEGIQCPSVEKCQGGRTGVGGLESTIILAGGSEQGLSKGETLVSKVYFLKQLCLLLLPVSSSLLERLFLMPSPP